MGKVIRFGVSMEDKFLKVFDKFIEKEGYKNRSEAIRDIIRKEFVDEEWDKGSTVAGGIMIVYDHHRRELVQKIMDIQHDSHDVIISTQHVHMDHHNCLEIIVVKGRADAIRKIYNLLKSLKGVKYASLSRATTGRNF